MSGFLCRHESVDTLPAAWDGLAAAPWQQRRFLAHAQAANPCAQRYYTWIEDGVCVAGAIVYGLPIDLLTYFPFKLPFSIAPNLRVCGVPASVSCPGLLGPPHRAGRLLTEVCTAEASFLVALNLDPDMPVPPSMSAGPTLPTITLEVPWRTMDEYEGALRADYRRRFRKIRARFAGCRLETTSCAAFTPAHYLQYLSVLNKSEAKLETLPEAFFRGLPEDLFELTTITRDGSMLGWLVMLIHGGRAAFFMGGMPENAQREPDLYFYVTCCVLQRAISRGARFLDLGQTAEIPKLRLGGRLEPRAMAVYHPSGALRLLLAAAAPLLSYHREIETHHVFTHCATGEPGRPNQETKP
ncbi:GNAT family N-acetyltransferase [Myxococcota bacterium]|nr:GNAT family N-acetyltransferase [Myxococcota bacterium]